VVNKFICWEWLSFVGQSGKLETKVVLRNGSKILLKSFFLHVL
jgi:hypothetical protein